MVDFKIGLLKIFQIVPDRLQPGTYRLEDQNPEYSVALSSPQSSVNPCFAENSAIVFVKFNARAGCV